MSNIPFTAENLHYVDEVTGVDYEMRQPTDEIEMALIDFEAGFESDVKKRLKLFNENEREYRRWINGHVDVILCGWSSASVNLPSFPSKPSAQMGASLKMQLLTWWNEQNRFTRDDLKK
jgi:hypothetical protein